MADAAASILSKRLQLFDMYSSLISPLAGEVGRRLPPSFERKDLEQAGTLALLDAAGAVETYLRKRIKGAMRNSVRRARYRDSTHKDLDTVNPDSMPADPSPSILDELIDKERTKAVQDSVKRLPPGQAGAIARLREPRKGRPRKADVTGTVAALHREDEASAIAGLRTMMVRAA